MKRFYRWELALMAGLLVGMLHLGPGGTTLPAAAPPRPEILRCARYQVNVFPFAVAHGTQPAAAVGGPEEREVLLRFCLPELWEKFWQAVKG